MTAIIFTLLLLAAPQYSCYGAAFVSRFAAKCHSTVTSSARDDFYHEPHFEVSASAVASEIVDEPMTLDRMLACAHEGECTVQEMDRMIAGTSNMCVCVCFACGKCCIVMRCKLSL